MAVTIERLSGGDDDADVGTEIDSGDAGGNGGDIGYDPAADFGEPRTVIIDGGDHGNSVGGTGGASSSRTDSDSHGDGYARNPDGSIKRNKDGSPRKQRGRKANVVKSAQVASFASICEITSHLLATASKTPECALDKDEAEQLGAAIKNVADMYPVQISDKAAAWFSLVLTTAIISVPRVVIVSQRLAEEKKTKQEEARKASDFSQTVAVPQPTGEPQQSNNSGGISLPPNVAFF